MRLSCHPCSSARLAPPPKARHPAAPAPRSQLAHLRRLSCRHLALRWPVLPQTSQVFSLLGQSATAWSIEPHAWHWLGSGHAPARWPNSPQLLQVLPASLRPRLSLPSPRSRRSRGADFSVWRDSIRHLILRCPVLPQVSHVLSRFGQSATAWEVDPQAWHWLASEHAPARWPNSPQLLQVLPPPPPPPPPP